MKKMLVLMMVALLVFVVPAMAQEDPPEDPNPNTTDGYLGTFLSPLVFDDSGYFVEGGDYANYDNHVDDDGKYTFTKVDANDPGAYSNLDDLDRTGYTRDFNSDTQSVDIKLNVEAYIPCFLEMKLTGNQGTAAGISYGSNANVDNNVGSFIILFDNEVGGFLDEGWQSMGHGSNAQINPGDNVFIGACDLFAVEVISNDNYRYSVKSDALVSSDTGVSGAKLPMHMRTSTDGGTSWNPGYVNFNSAKDVGIAERGPGEKLTAVHNFRVPFDVDTPHGAYTGDVTFRATTL